MKTVYGIRDRTLVWEDGVLSGPDPDFVAIIEGLLDQAVAEGSVFPATPTGPFFRGDELRNDALGFLVFLRYLFPWLRIVDGECPEAPYKDGVAY